jgi:hypothetical protein
MNFQRYSEKLILRIGPTTLWFAPHSVTKQLLELYDRDITRRFAKHNARFRYIRVSIDSAITDKDDKPLRDNWKIQRLAMLPAAC